MSEYNHRMTIVVPEKLMPQANQLALIAGESLDDVNTFKQTNFQDIKGNKYAVCSAVIKPIVLELINTPLSESPLQVEQADLTQAQAAMDKVVMYEQGVTANPDSIFIAIDVDPFVFSDSIGISLIDTNEELT